MSELSFLIELLLNHELKKETKDLIALRIKEVETTLTTKPVYAATSIPAAIPNLSQQAPSTLAAMEKHGMLGYVAPVIPAPVQAPPVVLNGNELQARENSLEILKKRKQQHLKA